MSLTESDYSRILKENAELKGKLAQALEAKDREIAELERQVAELHTELMKYSELKSAVVFDEDYPILFASREYLKAQNKELRAELEKMYSAYTTFIDHANKTEFELRQELAELQTNLSAHSEEIGKLDAIVVNALNIAIESTSPEALDYLLEMARELRIIAPNDEDEVQYG